MLKLGINGVAGLFSTYSSKWAFQYTTSAAKAPCFNATVQYLVNSLGFSEEEAFVTSSKVSRFKSTKNPDSVIHFFKVNGFNQTQIKKIVSTTPNLLSSNVEKTLKPKIKAFQDMGLYRLDLVELLSACPSIFCRSLDTHIIPTLELLKSQFGDDNLILSEFLKRSCWALSPRLRRDFPAIISLLQSYGFSDGQIKTFALRKARYFTLGPRKMQSILIRVEEKLGIPRGSPMFFHGICVLCSLSQESLEFKMAIYKSYGWTESDILTLARRNPYGLMISESKLRSCLNFYMNDLGYEPAVLASIANVLTYSLEKRVFPRHAVLKVLKEKGLKKADYSLISWLAINESQFCGRFVLPFKDQVPGLYDDYIKRVHSSLVAAK